MDLLEKSNSDNRHPWELARFRVVKDLVDRQVVSYKGKKILDVGCGDLYFLEQFSDDKPDSHFYAVDTAFDENFVHSKVNKSIKSFKSLEDLPTDENLTFDIVFLMDVIEHIEDDQAFLNDLVSRSFINEKTLIVITAPAYQKLFCHYDRFLGHHRRYTIASLERLSGDAGLTTIDKGNFFFSLVLPRSVEALLDMMKGREKGVTGTRLTSWNNHGAVTQLLKSVLYLDFKIHSFLKKGGIASPGLSNYLLCRKSVS